MQWKIYDRHGKARFASGATVAILFCAIWLIGVAGLFLSAKRAETSPYDVVIALVAIALPIILLWLARTCLRAISDMHDEIARLQAAMDSLRHTYAAQQQRATFPSRPAGARAGQGALVHPPAPAAEGADSAQPDLPFNLSSRGPQARLSINDLIRALNFPDSPNDAEGFRTLQLALADQRVTKLIRAAQDVLTLLSQNGIFMDDLHPAPAAPQVWRDYARGKRGSAIAAIASLDDAASRALSAERMAQDPIFHDAAHHFLRQFGYTLAEFEKSATDQEVAEVTKTRTARAFILLGSATGLFDT